MRGQKASKHAHYPPWDDKKWTLAADMWTNGHSAGEIAASLGPNFTRNAVLGKIHRMGFAERSAKPSKSRGVSVVKAKAGKKPQAAKAIVSAPSLAPVKPPAPIAKRQAYPERLSTLTKEEIVEATNHAPATAVGLLDLRTRQCRWPYGEREFSFCGAPVVTRQVNGLACPFCETHARIAYAPRHEKKKQTPAPRTFESALARGIAA